LPAVPEQHIRPEMNPFATLGPSLLLLVSASAAIPCPGHPSPSRLAYLLIHWAQNLLSSTWPHKRLVHIHGPRQRRTSRLDTKAQPERELRRPAMIKDV